MSRPRKFTSETLNSLCKNPEITVIKQCDEKNKN